MYDDTSFLEDRIMRERARSDAGFSLVEVLIAMTITLIISGAIYGLLSGGQNAFRREPELTDRQQNARIAMNVIMRDIQNAGSVGTSVGGNRAFMQVFTPGLDACASCPAGPSGVATDEIEMVTNNGERENEPVCYNPPTANSPDVELMRPVSIPNNTVVMVFMADDTWTLRTVTSSSTSTTNSPFSPACTSGGPGHTQLLFATGDPAGLNPSATGVCGFNPGRHWGSVTSTSPCSVAGIGFANVVRYHIQNDAAGVPVLARWSSDDPAAFTGGNIAPAGYQIVARGIEDLQVRYHQVGQLSATWVTTPVTVAAPTWTTLTNEVEVTLAARSEARNIQGARNVNGSVKIRGSLTSTGTPRATLFNMANAQVSPAPKPWF
jgi:prepilin-type N-terminal cleavage/methylation domain-containing protein